MHVRRAAKWLILRWVLITTKLLDVLVVFIVFLSLLLSRVLNLGLSWVIPDIRGLTANSLLSLISLICLTCQVIIYTLLFQSLVAEPSSIHYNQFCLVKRVTQFVQPFVS